MDAGGDGDCGYRALAAALKLAAGDPPEKAKANAVKHGASLRARAATWIKKKGKFRESFAVDDKWTEHMEAGPILQTYDEWVESCARPRRWIDGPGYIAAATVLERRILVQKFLDGRWCRVALYGPHESDANSEHDGPPAPCVSTVSERSALDHCNSVQSPGMTSRMGASRNCWRSKHKGGQQVYELDPRGPPRPCLCSYEWSLPVPD